MVKTKKKAKPLTIKQQAFVDCYTGSVKEAAKIAGLSFAYCRRMVTYGHIQDAIRNRQAPNRAKHIATRAERQEFWTKIMNGKVSKTLSNNDKMRASELLGKSELDFGERKVVEGEVKHTVVMFHRGKK